MGPTDVGFNENNVIKAQELMQANKPLINGRTRTPEIHSMTSQYRASMTSQYRASMTSQYRTSMTSQYRDRQGAETAAP
jgi:hypothetical protein